MLCFGNRPDVRPEQKASRLYALARSVRLHWRGPLARARQAPEILVYANLQEAA